MTLSHPVKVVAILDRAGDSPETIATQTDAFVQALAGRLGPRQWEIVKSGYQPIPWGGPLPQLTHIVRQLPSFAPAGEPDPSDGYAFTLRSEYLEEILSVAIGIGGPSIGRRTPQQSVRASILRRVDAGPAYGDPVDALLTDALLETITNAWAPLLAHSTNDALAKAAREADPLQGGWRYPIGSRVWLRNDVGAPITQLADGLTRREFAGGSIIAAPNEWTPEQIVPAFVDTYTRSGVSEVPHAG